jgi:uncharacterized membrane protein YgcG
MADIDPSVQRKIDELFTPTSGFSPHLIDDRARDFMTEISPEKAIQALEEFHEASSPFAFLCVLLMFFLGAFLQAMMDEGDRIRNKAAYFMGLLRRYRLGDGKKRGPGPEELPSAVRAKLETLYNEGFCQPKDIDERVVELLIQLSPDAAVDAIGEYSSIPSDRIKNHSAYLTGVLKRYLGGGGKGGGKGHRGGKGGDRFGGGGHGGGNGPPMGMITAAVEDGLSRLYESGFCRYICTTLYNIDLGF